MTRQLIQSLTDCRCWRLKVKVGSSDWCTRRSSLPVRCTGRGSQWMGNSDWADWLTIRVVKPKLFSISGSHFGTRLLVKAKLKTTLLGNLKEGKIVLFRIYKKNILTLPSIVQLGRKDFFRKLSCAVILFFLWTVKLYVSLSHCNKYKLQAGFREFVYVGCREGVIKNNISTGPCRVVAYGSCSWFMVLVKYIIGTAQTGHLYHNTMHNNRPLEVLKLNSRLPLVGRLFLDKVGWHVLYIFKL